MSSLCSPGYQAQTQRIMMWKRVYRMDIVSPGGCGKNGKTMTTTRREWTTATPYEQALTYVHTTLPVDSRAQSHTARHRSARDCSRAGLLR